MRPASGSLLTPADPEVVEVALRVGLAPEADLPGLLERVVVHVQVLLAVEVALDVVAGHGHAELVPGAGPRAYVRSPGLDAAAVEHVVDAEVVLQVVLARDVVVPDVPVAPHHAPALVFLPRHSARAD